MSTSHNLNLINGFMRVCAVARPTPNSFDIGTAPDFGTGAPDAIAQEVEIAGPFRGSCHRTASENSSEHAEVTGTPANNHSINH